MGRNRVMIHDAYQRPIVVLFAAEAGPTIFRVLYDD